MLKTSSRTFKDMDSNFDLLSFITLLLVMNFIDLCQSFWVFFRKKVARVVDYKFNKSIRDFFLASGIIFGFFPLVLGLVFYNIWHAKKEPQR